MLFEKLFDSPHREKIQRILPTLFRAAESECRRGRRVGMEVGAARERILIAFFIHTFGESAVTFPEVPSHAMDFYLGGKPLAIKTITGTGGGGVKLSWTVDWKRVEKIYKEYHPTCDILFVHIDWKGTSGGLYWIPLHVQQKIFAKYGRATYIRLPKRGTNPRGMEISGDTMGKLRQHPETLFLPVDWRTNKNLPPITTPYARWVQLWEAF